jgi:hypothetical protein
MKEVHLDKVTTSKKEILTDLMTDLFTSKITVGIN